MEQNKKRIEQLQLITQRPTREGVMEEVAAYIAGGGRWVQLRMKEQTPEFFESVARDVLALCRAHGVTFVINDSAEIAARVGADGVHVGKNDIFPKQARAILGNDKIVGATANTIEDVLRHTADGVDYIGLGPFRFTTTKKGLSPVLGEEGYTKIIKDYSQQAEQVPVIAIGGIKAEDISTLRGCGVTHFAVSGSISNTQNPAAATTQFVNEINKTI